LLINFGVSDTNILVRLKSIRSRLGSTFCALMLAATLTTTLLQGTAFADATSTMLSGPSEANVYGEPIDFTVTIYGSAPSGTMTLMDGSKQAGTGTLDLLPGSHSPVVAGYLHSCAITDGGAAKCLGDNNQGQLGDNTLTDKPVPTAISDFGTYSVLVPTVATVTTNKIKVKALSPSAAKPKGKATI
jgi:hypothetical protein